MPKKRQKKRQKKQNERRPLILVTYPMSTNGIKDILKKKARVIIPKNLAEFEKILPKADGLVTLLTDTVDKKLLQKGVRLKVVGNCAVGVDNINLAACKELGIRVVNTPNVLTRATAEFTLSLLLAAARRHPEGERLTRSGKFLGWHPHMLRGLELKNRQAIIVGKGRIGKETAKLFKGIGIKVDFIERKDSQASIEKKLRRAQILSLHIPKTSETFHWLGKKRLRFLPLDSIVINTSRGTAIDEKALIEVLEKNRIFAAALDVYEKEPKIPSALRKLSNCLLLPHLGSATHETREAMARLAYEGTLSVLLGKKPGNQLI